MECPEFGLTSTNYSDESNDIVNFNLWSRLPEGQDFGFASRKE